MDYIDDMSLALPNQQQVGESNIDFKRFQYYLGLGASRSYEKVSNNFTITDRRVKQIAAKNQWQDRIKAINKMLNEQIINEVLAQVGETARDLWLDYCRYIYCYIDNNIDVGEKWQQ